MTLAEALLRRPNGLNLVRLALASLVIALHTWTVGGDGATAPSYGSVAQWAVPGFFCVSGFLIAGSRMRLSIGRFWWHRALRILPAYWACLAVVAFVLSPISTAGGGTWDRAGALDYVVDNALLIQFQRGVGNSVDGQVWNGSLWTLSFEFVAYVIAGLILTGATRTQATTAIGTIFVCLSLGNVWVLGPGHVDSKLAITALQLACYFTAGMMLYFLAGRVLVRGSWALASLSFLTISTIFGVELMVGPLPLAYLVLWLGASIPHRWTPGTDVSYGVFIYAFPMQVLLEWFLPELPLAVHGMAALLLALPVAWLSWQLVERPSLRMKDVGRRSKPKRRPLQPVGDQEKRAGHRSGSRQ